METPWGIADNVEHIADGIQFVTTPSHGGFRLSAVRNAHVPGIVQDHTFRGLGLIANGSWYEEDCDAALVPVFFPECFPAVAVEAAHASLAAQAKWDVQRVTAKGG